MNAPRTRRPRLCCLTLAIAACLGGSLPASAAETQRQAQATPASEAWVINLESSTFRISPSDRPALAAFRNLTVYVVAVEIRGVTWYRLRMGFFGSKREAEKALATVEDQFPDAWVALVDPAEARSTAAAPPQKQVVPPVPGSDTTGAADLMRRAHDAMVVGDYSRAIRLYTEVLETPANPYARDAQELLGLAKERNGQLAQARSEYETYLRLYPQGEGTERVRQRLLGLVTAREASPKALRTVEPRRTDSGWSGFGSFSQYFRWDQFEVDGTSSNQSALISDLDYTLRRRGTNYDIRARFSGGYEHVFAEDEETDETQLSKLYVEALGSDLRWSGTLGRQSRSDSGLLGRFDGAFASKPLTSNTRVNFSAGLPVDTGEEDRLNSHKHFAGLSFDVRNIGNAFDTNAYFVQQDVDGILDRQAVGGEVRYAKDGRSLFTLVDYDVLYETVNTAFALMGWSKPDGTTLNLILDYRKTPVLTTSNALMSLREDPANPGSTIPWESISEMLDTLSEEEIRQIAEERTSLSRSATLSVAAPLSETYQLMGDVTVSSVTGLPAIGDPANPLLEETPDTGTETFYAVQLIGNSLLKTGDTTLFGTRYADTRTANTVSLTINHRRPVSERFYLNPRLRVDFTQDDTFGDETTYAAGLRLTRQFAKDLSFEGEIDGQWSDREVDVGSGETTNYFVFFGLRKEL